MSTKFSIRPAPRKRPWICKRSPPCLKPPLFPPSLTCTFFVQKMAPAPIGPRHAGSLILDWNPPSGYYDGIWRSGLDLFHCVFIHDTITGLSQATATWDFNFVLQRSIWPEQTIPLHPNILYNVYSPSTTTWQWRGQLTITG